MIVAKKSAWFETIFLAYTRNLFWRRFHSLRVAGLENLRERDCSLPLVLYANHSSWWDPLTAFVISKQASLDAFAMMEEKNLTKLQFFRKIGAFSVVRENPREAIKSINYTTDLLKARSNRAVWIFPQGAIQPNDLRPLKFYNGAARIIAKTEKCLAAPVAMRYEFLDDFKPQVFARIGKIELFEKITNAKKLTARCTDALTVCLETIKTDVLRDELNDYTKI